MQSDQQYQLNHCGRIRRLLVMALAWWLAPGGLPDVHAECARQWNALIRPSVYQGIPFTAFEFDDGSGSALYIGGAIAKPSVSTTHTFVLKFDGENWSEVGGGFTKLFPFAGPTIGTVKCFGVYRGELIVAGNFNTVGNEPINSIARLHNGVWLPFGEGILGDSGFGVLAVCEFQDKLIAGGDFTSTGEQPASRIAAWDGTGWLPLGSGITTSFQPTVYALFVHDDKLLVGGNFSSAGGVSGTSRVAIWNGNAWSNAMSPGAFGTVRTFHEHQGQLLAGGTFSGWRTGVLYWNGTQWTTFGGLDNYTINSLFTLNDDLFAVGNFNACPGQPVTTNVVSRRDGENWISISSGITIFGCFTGIADAIPYHHSLLIVGDLSVGPPFSNSGMATLDPIDPVPSIVEQADGQSLILGHTFSAAVVAQETMTYQWRRHGVAITDDGRISGATTSNLTITDVDFPDGGQYDVLAINDCGQVASEPVTLTIACGGARPNGDLNFDGATDGLDIPLFMDAVLAGSQAGAIVCKADFTYDHVMTDADIGPFVTKLLDE